MKYINPISFAFMRWFAGSVCRVKVLTLIIIAGALWSFADVWLEQRDGTASVRFVRGHSTATIADKPDEFALIIRFEIFRSFALVLLAVVLQGAASAVGQYDIFAPGQKYKNMGEE